MKFRSSDIESLIRGLEMIKRLFSQGQLPYFTNEAWSIGVIIFLAGYVAGEAVWFFGR